MLTLDFDGAETSHTTQKLNELVALGGREKIADMLRRFCDQLHVFLAAEPTTPWPVSDVHRLVGLAAVLGFSQVEKTWRRLETIEPCKGDGLLAREAAEATILFIKGWLDRADARE